MENLPLELLSLIIEQLWEDPPASSYHGPSLRLKPQPAKAKSKDGLLTNLRSVRLVSKGFCHASSTLFGTTYFSARWVSLSRPSLESFLSVAQTRHLARHMHTLRVSAVDFDPALDAAGTSMVLLSTALSHLEQSSSLSSILLSLKCTHKPSSSSSSSSPAAALPCAVEPAVAATVRTALLYAHLHPSRLRIYTNTPSALLLASAPHALAHATTTRALTSLKLDLLNPSSLDPRVHDMLARATLARFLAAAAPTLEHLSLYFAREIWYRVPLAKVLGGSMPALKSLRACGFNCRADELVALLALHRRTLRRVELADFKLRRGTWADVFAAMAVAVAEEEEEAEEVVEGVAGVHEVRLRRVWDRESVFALSDVEFRRLGRRELQARGWERMRVARADVSGEVEPVELGAGGAYVSFPEDMLWDHGEEGDVGGGGGDEVAALPYSAQSVGLWGEWEGSESGTSGTGSMASVGSVEVLETVEQVA